ncbi:MAG: hypothetical protein ACE5I7_02080 [Candidatus Binatia bacterium]
MSDAILTDIEARLKLAGLTDKLGRALSHSADPGHAPALAASILAAAGDADRARLRAVWADRPGALVRVLACLCGAAQFLVPFLLRHPRWLCELAADDLSLPRSAPEYVLRLRNALDRVPSFDRGDALRRFKYYELARITVRELSDDLVPEERVGTTLAEISHLADALLSSALACTAAALGDSCGPPSWSGPQGERVDLGFCVLALGKLGAEELNYSSDVDLVYMYEDPPAPLSGGPRGMAPPEYFTRWAQEFGRLVGRPTSEGFLYRIDLSLRPEGSQSPLVVSGERLVGYYELWAATWERAAFMKARPVAGDLGLGWRTIHAIAPMIYRSTMDYAGVAAIKEMKERIEQTRGRATETFDVKIGSGGIRDIEFIVQALQMLHGGRIPQLRVPSTEAALCALAEAGVLPGDAAAQLAAAYRFLRRTENGLQMEAERQTHHLPKQRDKLERLARALHFLAGDPVAGFEQALATHRGNIRRIFTALFPRSASERVLALFSRNVPAFLATAASRRMIEDLAGRFAAEVERSADPERAMNNLNRFIHGVGRRRFYYELLLDRPELVPRLTGLFAASEYLSSYFSTHPRLIEPVFSDPNLLLLSRQQLRQSLAEISRDLAREEGREKVEAGLDALRLFHNRELINVGLLDLAGKITSSETERALTDIAEVCVEQGLVLAQAELERRQAQGREAGQLGEFLVVGLGKMASRELTYGSDLDVIFLYDVAGRSDRSLLAAQEYFVRLAQKLIWALQVRTKEGVCYQIDARLRPSGNQGMLVCSLPAFRHYHETSAQVWERQALLRARPVAGGKQLAQTFETLRQQILRKPLPANLREEIHRIRLRMESELARETAQRHDFKTGRGGLLDVEAVVQLLQLQHGRAHPQLFAPDSVATQLTRLEALGLLATGDARRLREGWAFLQRLSSCLRVVANRSISDLDEERGDLDALARRLGYTSPQRPGGARRALLDDYRRHTGAIRAVYAELFGVPG